MGAKINQRLIFNAVALAMGVSGTVLAILGDSLNTILILFGIGIFCLAINGLDKE